MRYSEEEKKMWMDDWAESGLSAWAYSRKNSVNGKIMTRKAIFPGNTNVTVKTTT